MFILSETFSQTNQQMDTSGRIVGLFSWWVAGKENAEIKISGYLRLETFKDWTDCQVKSIHKLKWCHGDGAMQDNFFGVSEISVPTGAFGVWGYWKEKFQITAPWVTNLGQCRATNNVTQWH